MTQETIIVRKNRMRAFWALVIVLFMVPISGWLLVTGLQPGRPDIAWALVIFGLVGLAVFTASAVGIIRTMCSPWHLSIGPSRMTLYTETYDLNVPWDSIAGIVVDEVNRRPGCALIFKDPTQVVQAATFHANVQRPDAVTDAETMQARMQENSDELGYHLGIPGRLLELGPEALAELLARAQAGQIWLEREGQP